MRRFQTLDDLAVSGKRVLLRADLNVPVKNGRVTDATRIERLAPTIKELIAKGARVVVMSHFGRPEGKRNPAYSLEPLVGDLSKAIGVAVAFASESAGPEAEGAVAQLKPGAVLLLENLRFHGEEEANDQGFARRLAALGDIYVNDAFSAAHRAHASTAALAHLLPAAAGRLMQAELEALEAALGDPKRPVAAVVGGAKVSTKLDLLGNLVGRVDKLLIGGGMANTFLHARGVQVGKSLCERDLAPTAREIVARAKTRGCEILLQTDAVVATKLEAGVPTQIVAASPDGTWPMPTDGMMLDIGPVTIQRFVAALGTCRTLVWNGPLGAFETAPFDRGTTEVAQAAAAATQAGRLLSVAGGGDTVAALIHAGAIDGFSYVSTAGGAFLEWMEGKELPGVAALAQR
ncbi:MAG: phosphoglycerate kinase [Alphaproteobacteria bacterium]|nr:phosphoglycerate kinase [Alphaproteobacteria bacterium]